MAKLTIQEVERVADLAKLSLTSEEKQTFQEQLSSILEYAEMIQQVDTTDILPSASALPLDNVMRGDVMTTSLPTEKALANAPQMADNQFKVRAVLD